MISKIRVYNVGFVDSFILYGHECKLLVDCGTSKLGKVVFANIIKDIDNELSGKTTGLLTHFHKAHYSGIEQLKKDAFDTFYLPNFFTKEEIIIQLYTIALLRRRTNAYRFAYNLLSIIPKLINKNIVKTGGTIKFAKQGDKIVNNIEVLWPTLCNKSTINQILDNIKSRIINYIDIYKKENTEDISHLKELSERINSIADNYIRLQNKDATQYC